MKICTICEASKSLEEFSKCVRNKDGLHAYCRPCDAERRRIRYQNHRKEEIESAVEWNKKHPHLVKRYQHNWYISHKNKVMEDQRHYRSNKRLRKYERLLGLQEIK